MHGPHNELCILSRVHTCLVHHNEWIIMHFYYEIYSNKKFSCLLSLLYITKTFLTIYYKLTTDSYLCQKTCHPNFYWKLRYILYNQLQLIEFYIIILQLCLSLNIPLTKMYTNRWDLAGQSVWICLRPLGDNILLSLARIFWVAGLLNSKREDPSAVDFPFIHSLRPCTCLVWTPTRRVRCWPCLFSTWTAVWHRLLRCLSISRSLSTSQPVRWCQISGTGEAFYSNWEAAIWRRDPLK